MNDLEKFISETRDEKNPMDNWTRVIIETEEKNPKPIAVITNDNFELAKDSEYDYCLAKINSYP